MKSRRRKARDRREQEQRWAQRQPRRELTASPVPDDQAAAERHLARLEAERQRQAAAGDADHVPRKAGKGYVRLGGRSSA